MNKRCYLGDTRLGIARGFEVGRLLQTCWCQRLTLRNCYLFLLRSALSLEIGRLRWRALLLRLLDFCGHLSDLVSFAEGLRGAIWLFHGFLRGPRPLLLFPALNFHFPLEKNGGQLRFGDDLWRLVLNHLFTVSLLHTCHPFGGLVGEFELICTKTITRLTQLKSLAFGCFHPYRCLVHGDLSMFGGLLLFQKCWLFREKHRRLLGWKTLQIYERNQLHSHQSKYFDGFDEANAGRGAERRRTCWLKREHEAVPTLVDANVEERERVREEFVERLGPAHHNLHDCELQQYLQYRPLIALIHSLLVAIFPLFVVLYGVSGQEMGRIRRLPRLLRLSLARHCFLQIGIEVLLFMREEKQGYELCPL